MTAQQTYLGLAGMLEIGRPDGNLPIVTQNDIPVRSMALQYNFVFDRRNGGHQLNNVTWPQWANTARPPTGDELANGTYPASLAPVNFTEATTGSQVMTFWYAGPQNLPIKRTGGDQFIPGQPAALHEPDEERRRPTRRFRTTNATSSSPSTGNFSRTSR